MNVKVLVAFYSRTGSTEALAQSVAEKAPTEGTPSGRTQLSSAPPEPVRFT